MFNSLMFASYMILDLARNDIGGLFYSTLPSWKAVKEVTIDPKALGIIASRL